MFIISQPCSVELCLYKVKRGNFGITVQKYPHTQQHIIHKAPRLYMLTRYNSAWGHLMYYPIVVLKLGIS